MTTTLAWSTLAFLTGYLLGCWRTHRKMQKDVRAYLKGP